VRGYTGGCRGSELPPAQAGHEGPGRPTVVRLAGWRSDHRIELRSDARRHGSQCPINSTKAAATRSPGPDIVLRTGRNTMPRWFSGGVSRFESPTRPWPHGTHRRPERGAVIRSIRRSPLRPASHSSWCFTNCFDKLKGCFIRSPTCSASPWPYRIIRRCAAGARRWFCLRFTGPKLVRSVSVRSAPPCSARP
jgi:hypothetical protein